MKMRITNVPVIANLHDNSGVGTFLLRILVMKEEAAASEDANMVSRQNQSINKDEENSNGGCCSKTSSSWLSVLAALLLSQAAKEGLRRLQEQCAGRPRAGNKGGVKNEEETAADRNARRAPGPTQLLGASTKRGEDAAKEASIVGDDVEKEPEVDHAAVGGTPTPYDCSVIAGTVLHTSSISGGFALLACGKDQVWFVEKFETDAIYPRDLLTPAPIYAYK